MTHVTIGLRRTCFSPSSWPGHPPSVWPVWWGARESNRVCLCGV